MEIAKDPKYNIGVLVARFQVPALTIGHKDLINRVLEKHEKLLIVLGCAHVKHTKNNPFDFSARKQMILEDYPASEFPQIEIAYNHDQRDDNTWSKNLDAVISNFKGPSDKVILYGARDSFIPHYHGVFATRELQENIICSGTDARNKVGKSAPKPSLDFRLGVVWASFQRYATAFPTTDILVVRNGKMLLGRKTNETKYRFIGGFVDPNDSSIEAAAKRELNEESGLDIAEEYFNYICSTKVNDWRYRKEQDGIITTLFAVDGNETHIGVPEAADDIAELVWLDIPLVKDEREMTGKVSTILIDTIADKIVDEHIKMFYNPKLTKFLINHINNIKVQ